MTFYETYIARCQEAGISPSAAAEAAGISRASVSRWKRGSLPSDVKIASVAKALGLSLKQFWADESGGWNDTPAQTVRGELMLKVSEMDEESAAKLLKIAEECGFFK